MMEAISSFINVEIGHEVLGKFFDSEEKMTKLKFVMIAICFSHRHNMDDRFLVEAK